jgi:NAD-dependent deacetylase
MDPANHSDPNPLADLLRPARKILIFTGAGISTASGIPDFRGPQGVWKQRRPIYYREFMASEEARVAYWDYKLEAWEKYVQAHPNCVHEAVVELERAGKLELVVTQNIDGLHQRAGTTGARLVELHGTNALVECQSCGERGDPAPHFLYFKSERRAPRCSCGGFLKPATISFGQGLRREDLERAFAAAMDADLAVSLGSTLAVEPAASVPLAAAERGVPYAVVNRGETAHDGHPALSVRLEGDVGELFPAAVREALGE